MKKGRKMAGTISLIGTTNVNHVKSMVRELPSHLKALCALERKPNASLDEMKAFDIVFLSEGWMGRIRELSAYSDATGVQFVIVFTLGKETNKRAIRQEDFEGAGAHRHELALMAAMTEKGVEVVRSRYHYEGETSGIGLMMMMTI
ncbi:hypothetical protein IMZ31_21525 (plasmid) [Pontibacillus sp. ALD_SL1]|uniref:hypothetical protein n=1 Tax=Pontibacillus sp. ALD_SL1 TaxID=2777185 RepID=UPI001A9763C3|nr:hypothetical protein [Pontibacillus sp. ALD_SL1]QST02034.1 hypothetical protein IMZ31_21525 [Pontibacillus sp. ALD_SL1]